MIHCQNPNCLNPSTCSACVQGAHLREILFKIQHAYRIGDLIHALQLERSNVALFMASNRSFITFRALQEFYKATDNKVSTIQYWPEAEANVNSQYYSKLGFKQQMDKERQNILNSNRSVWKQIEFYNDANELLINTLSNQLTSIIHSILWKQFIIYKTLNRANENFSITIAIAIEFYIYCSMSDQEQVVFITNDA